MSLFCLWYALQEVAGLFLLGERKKYSWHMRNNAVNII